MGQNKNILAPVMKVKAGRDLHLQFKEIHPFQGQIEGNVSQIVSYEWDFNGDGVWDSHNKTNQAVKHQYLKSGRFQAIFSIIDKQGIRYSDFISVTVSNEIPKASAGRDTVISIGDEIKFMGTAKDREGPIRSYSWDFESDGNFDTVFIKPQWIPHRYKKSGEFVAILKVLDEDSAEVRAGRIIQVVVDPPWARSSPDTTVSIKDEVLFGGKGGDRMGRVIQFRWDYDGDGRFDWKSAHSAETRFKFFNAGTYAAVFEVMDDDSQSSRAVRRIQVLQDPPKIDCSHQVVAFLNQPCLLQGRGQDTFGRIILYAWDFDKNGTWDVESAKSGETTHLFKMPGTKTIIFQVMDDDSNTQNAVVTVQVINRSPEALGQKDTVVSIDDTVWFTSEAKDSDSPVVLFQWDYQSDGRIDWESEKEGKAFYIYREAGLYIALQRVVDAFGSGDLAERKITVLRDPPILKMGRDTSIFCHQQIKYDYSCDDQFGKVIRLEWDFEGDQKVDLIQTKKEAVVFTYSEAGLYCVKLGILDDDQNLTRDSLWVSVINRPPLIEIGNDTTLSIYKSMNFSIKARDPDGAAVKIYWDFDGDGKIDQEGSSQTSVEHTYNKEGRYLVRVTARDDHPEISFAHQMITVINQPPIVKPGPDTVVSINDTVFYSGHAQDPEGQIAEIGWDVDGDGKFEWTDKKNFTKKYVFKRNGVYQSVLRVTDQGGRSGQEIRRITVLQDEPKVEIQRISTPHVNQVVYFQGSAKDRFGEITQYAWDFDGDGDFDWKSDKQSSTTHSYKRAGNYLVVFKALDDDINTVLAKIQITVLNSPPLVEVGTEVGGSVGDVIYLSGKAQDEDGKIVLYEWDFNGDGEIDWKSSTEGGTQTNYQRVGQYRAVFRATDEQGLSTTRIKLIDIIEDRPTLAGRKDTLISIHDTILFYGLAHDVCGKIKKFEWDFEGDGKFDWSSEKSLNCFYAYPKAGRYNAVARVTDDDKMITVAATLVDVLQDPPVAYAGQDTLVSVNQAVLFTGEGRDIYGQIKKCSWDFDGDGRLDWESSRLGTTSYTYLRPGLFPAYFYVMDDDQNRGVDSIWVTVVNLPPTVKSNPDTSVSIFDRVAFGCHCEDSDGRIKEYRWDFDGDGKFDYLSAATCDTNFSFSQSGTFKARIQVADDVGYTAETFRMIYVFQDPPVATAISPVTAAIHQAVTFKGEARDSMGQIKEYLWDFEGDGKFDYKDALRGNTQHPFDHAGHYNAIFRCVDDDHNIAEALVQVQITNTPPVLDLFPDKTLSINDSIILEAKAHDKEGRIVLYEWDLDGDGQFELKFKETNRAIRKYTKLGVYIFTCRVTDDDQLQSSERGQITIIQDPPLAHAGVDTSVNDSATLQLRGQGEDRFGKIRLYEWDFNADGKFDWTSMKNGEIAHHFSKTAVPILRVTDDDGNQTLDSFAVLVCPRDMFGIFPGRFCIDEFEWPNRFGKIPTSNVSWFAAKDSCQRVHKRLCEEAEWEIACRGKNKKRYPLGDSIPSMGSERQYCNLRGAMDNIAVASGIYKKCVSEFGVKDLSGNVSEWTNQWDRGQKMRAAMGGHFFSNVDEGTCTSKSFESPAGQRPEIGFRCCR